MKQIVFYQHQSEIRLPQQSPGAGDGRVKYWSEAINNFKKGLKKLNVSYVTKTFNTDFEGSEENLDVKELDENSIVVFWGTKKKSTPRGRYLGFLIDFLKNKHIPWITIERGFVKRSDYCMIGWTGLNGRAHFKNENMPSDRWKKLETKLKDWNDKGENILVCGQSPCDASIDHVDYLNWLDHTMSRLRELTKRKILFRPHPDLMNHPNFLFYPPQEQLVEPLLSRRVLRECGVHVPSHVSEISNPLEITLEEELENAWITISYNSNSGVESIINGVPTCSFDEGSMAKEMSTPIEKIESPYKGERAQWAYDLAYTQWTFEEMAEGLPWLHLAA